MIARLMPLFPSAAGGLSNSFLCACRRRTRCANFRIMSTLAEIEAAIAQLPLAHWLEIRRWMDAHAPKGAASENAAPAAVRVPDFLARQKAVFGGRMLPDSQAVLDEMRAERF